MLIPKNEIFSFNKAIGDISSATGYKQAYIIKNGRTVLGDGGGVCQVSTTLFRTALNAGLPIKERIAHAYRVHYYENDGKPGFDATVFDPSADLKFENNTPAHILIQSYVDQENNWLIFIFYGKNDSRKIEISQATVWDVLPPPEPLYQDDPTLKKGAIKQVDWASWGAKAKFHYKVEKEGKVIIDQDFFSSYRPWQAVYLVGTTE
jgi:vancomycin resistance protein YoaR